MKRQHDGFLRTQVQLESRQLEGLRQLASRREVSVAQLVREGVDRLLADEREADPWTELFEIVGKYGAAAPRESVARNHDLALDEAYAEWREST